ncbi:MAG: hypothetical protein AB4372_04525 [Xenococcus sp. (in: cyanobacteria)]
MTAATAVKIPGSVFQKLDAFFLFFSFISSSPNSFATHLFIRRWLRYLHVTGTKR